ncbi:hypothetical protein K9L67_05535, partial [Candidatus Woesearchaeota archaeon]|nr:hypothetical protein [Candidatus Woesearchaeota archaeon]
MNVCKLVRKTLGNDLTKNQKQLAEEGKQLEGKYFTEKYSKTNEGYILEHQYWEFKKIILKNTIIGIPATTN